MPAQNGRRDSRVGGRNRDLGLSRFARLPPLRASRSLCSLSFACVENREAVNSLVVSHWLDFFQKSYQISWKHNSSPGPSCCLAVAKV